MDYAVFSDGNRRRSPKYAKTKAEANVLKGQLEEVERATKTRLAAKRDVDAWIERGWLKLEEALSIFEGYAETVADQLLFSTDYDAILDAFEEYSGQTCKGGFGGRQHIKNGSQARKVINWLASASPNISDLTVEMIHQKLNEMRTSYTDWSLHHFLQKMKLLLDHAVKLNMLHENPARKISLRKDLNVRMKIATVRRILTLNEIDVLLESSLQYPDLLNGSLPVIVRVGLYAGFRNEEVSWFDWNWIDWDTGILDMQATTCQANGENWVPKDYETRRLDVKDACIDYLRFEKKRQAKAGLLGQFVIPSGSKKNGSIGSGKPVNPGTPSRVFGKLIKREGLDPGITYYSLRHTYCTSLLRKSPNGAGLDLETVRDRMGHSDIRTTMAYLRDIEPEEHPTDGLPY